MTRILTSKLFLAMVFLLLALTHSQAATQTRTVAFDFGDNWSRSLLVAFGLEANAPLRHTNNTQPATKQQPMSLFTAIILHQTPSQLKHPRDTYLVVICHHIDYDCRYYYNSSNTSLSFSNQALMVTTKNIMG